MSRVFIQAYVNNKVSSIFNLIMISCRNAFFRFIIFGYLDQSLRNVMTMGAAVVDPVMPHHPCAGGACDGPGKLCRLFNYHFPMDQQ